MIATRNMILGYRCEGGQDSSANGFDVTLNSNVGVVGGVIGNAWSFPGVFGQRLSVAHDSKLDIIAAMTWAAWVRRNADVSSLWRYIIAKRNAATAPDNYSIEFEASTHRLYLWTHHSTLGWRGVGSIDALPLNQWEHRAIVLDQGDVTFYRNGLVISHQWWGAYSSMPASLQTNTHPLSIGAASNDTSNLPANLDHMVLLDLPLGQSDVKRLMLGLHPLSR